MVRYDIITAIRNAVERGESIEKARQVLINSGYNVNDVNEAVNYLTGGASNELQNATYQNQPTQPQQTQQPQIANQPKVVSQSIPTQNQNVPQKLPVQMNHLVVTSGDEAPNKKKNTVAIIILAVLLVLLFATLMLTLIFQEQVISFFQKLMGS
ncbi:MAG: hypothetical protein WC796_00250 [Candidatus Pacearchaeota archaeon]|jgi:hypothetical protein